MTTNNQPILAIDPGDKRIGVAISDESNFLARPLTVIQHKSRDVNAYKIIALAKKHQVKLILIGQALDEDGDPTFSGRKANRLAGAINAKSEIPVLLWDESHSTQQAKELGLKFGTKKSKRKGHQDDLAAAFILQSYLDK